MRLLIILIFLFVSFLVIHSCSSSSPAPSAGSSPDTSSSTAATPSTIFTPADTSTPVPVDSSAPAASGGVPATAADVAAEFGGSSDQWMKQDDTGQAVGPNGWIYRSSGQQTISFTVPDGCVVDTPQGRLSAGEQVNGTDLTIYWVSS